MAFLVWGLLACTGVFWLIQVTAKPLAAPPQTQPVVEQNISQVDLTRLLGAPLVAAAEVAPAAESRFKLLGVVAPKSNRPTYAGEGVALIAVDGVPRTVRVGAAIDDDFQLLAVDAHSAKLGKGGVVSINLQLAAPTAAATGALAPAAQSNINLGGNMIQPQVTPQMPPGFVPPGQQQQMQQGQPPQQMQQQPQLDNRGNPIS